MVRTPSSLFPLPLAPFETMMVLDDRKSHPMTCAAEFTFEGQFCRKKFDSAVEQTYRRHPLYYAQIERTGWQWRWLAPQVVPSVDWRSSADPWDDRVAAHIDLSTEPGLRISAQESQGQTRLFFEFHHACSDGAGGLTFVEDLLTHYAAACPATASNRLQPSTIDIEQLRVRHRFAGAWGWTWQRLQSELLDAAETSRFFGRAPVSIAARPGGALDVLPRPPVGRLIHQTLSAETLQSLQMYAAGWGATVNDLLIRSLLLTIQNWNQRRQAAPLRSQDWIRILLPWNLRCRDDAYMPATNRMSYAFLNRRYRELNDAAGLLTSIMDETSRMRREHLPVRVMSKLAIVNRIPGLLPFILSRQKCLATAILSNVGDPTRRFRARFPRDRGLLVAGDVRLTDFRAVSPIRPQTHASFFVNTYGQRLSIATRFDAEQFGTAEASLFLNQFADTLVRGVDAVERRKAA